MDPCPYSKGKRKHHNLMAFYVDGDKDVPITLLCSWCGSAKQYPLTWSQGGTLDGMSSEEILRAVSKEA
jgi:hypothetical protein